MTFRRNDARHFTRKVMSARYAYANGCCEACGEGVRQGHFHYHHEPPFEIAQDSSFDACRLFCDLCHEGITSFRDIPWIAKSDRQRDKHRAAMPPSRTPLPCGKKSPFKTTIGGHVVRRTAKR